MNEDQKQPVTDATKTQTNGGLEQSQTPDKTEQQNVVNSESMANQEQNQNTADKSVNENTTAETPQEKPADTSTTDSPTTKPADRTQPTQAKDDAAKATTTPATNDQQSKPVDTLADKSQTTDQDKPATENPAKNFNNPTAEPKKLSDVVPSTIVWLSGMVGKKQFDCAGPFSVPFKLDKPTWPYVTIAPNPNYTNQVFDYDADGGTGKWVPTDAKSQGQLLTDLAKQVTTLKDDSQKHDQSADQSQKMGMQLTKVMLQLSSKVDALNTKIDGIVNNEKDGDK